MAESLIQTTPPEWRRILRTRQVSRYFYASSDCTYPMYRQESPDVNPLKEQDAYPADPEEGYGWEKLSAEKPCQCYTEEGKLETHMPHDTSRPQGVRGRNSDNTRLREVLGWEPQTSLEDGLARAYQWIAAQRPVRG